MRVRVPRRTIPVSHCARPVPRWAVIKADLLAEIVDTETPPATPTSVSVIKLDSAASCGCSLPRTPFDPFQCSKEVACVVYSLSTAWEGMIEVQNCSSCKRRFIGPDGRQLGLFNWNNRILVTESLLDDYTSSFLASETPFVAFASVIARRYESHRSAIPFLSEKTFREIWFGYIALIDLEKPVACLKCGPEPENSIWDGVTLSFSKAHVRDSLEPPTVLTSQSSRRQNVSYIPRQQCLPNKDLRQLIRGILTGPSLLLSRTELDLLSSPQNTSEEDQNCALISESESGTDDDEPQVVPSGKATSTGGQASHRVKKNNSDILKRVESIPAAVEKLAAVNIGLSRLFSRWFGLEALAAGAPAPGVYRRLVIQVNVHPV